MKDILFHKRVDFLTKFGFFSLRATEKNFIKQLIINNLKNQKTAQPP